MCDQKMERDGVEHDCQMATVSGNSIRSQSERKHVALALNTVRADKMFVTGH